MLPIRDVCGGFLAATLFGNSSAQTFPSRNIAAIFPFATGNA